MLKQTARNGAGNHVHNKNLVRMGRQDSVIKILGQVDGLTFYKSQRGYEVRKRSGVSGDRIRKDPAFARTRENGQEFARAGQASRKLRIALRSAVVKNSDRLMASRMMREMMKVVKADTVHTRGMREALPANIGLLEGFEFNASASLVTTMKAPFQATIDRVTGVVEVTVPEFIPEDMITPPEGATHARLVIAGLELNLTDGQYVVKTGQSDSFLLDSPVIPAITLSQALPPASVQPLFLAFGISFFQLMNGALYPLKNGTHNAMALIKTDGGV